MLGPTLRHLRQQRRESMRQVAERAGITLQALHTYETGRRVPRLSTLQAIGAALGCEVSVVLTPTDPV